MMYIVDLSLFILLIFMSKEDLFDQTVSNKYTYAFLILPLLFSNVDLASKSIAVLIAFLVIISDDKLQSIGAADILIYAGLLARFGISNAICFILVVNLMGLAAFAFQRKHRVAMMPAFLVSYPILIFIL